MVIKRKDYNSPGSAVNNTQYTTTGGSLTARGRGSTALATGGAGGRGPRNVLNFRGGSRPQQQEGVGQLISREQGKKLGMGWQQRTALNREILSGANQRANTRISNQGDMDVTGLKTRGMLDATRMSEQGDTARNAAYNASREGTEAASLAEKVRQYDQGRYDTFMSSATAPGEDGTPGMSSGQAAKEFGYRQIAQTQGSDAAEQVRANDEIKEAAGAMHGMTEQQRSQYISTLSPMAQEHYNNLPRITADQGKKKTSLLGRASQSLEKKSLARRLFESDTIF